MEYSGFFNALESGGVYDRTYNANDYSHNLATIISNGVRRSEDDDLRVTASGMLATVAVGRAWINGHYYYNDTPLTFAAVTAPTGGARWDRVVLRLDNSISARKVSLVYVKGTAANSPAKPAPVRSGDIYDLVLADIYVGTNATSIIVTDTRANASVCGWVYSTAGDNSFFKTLDNAFAEWFTEKKDTLSTVTTEVEYKQLTTLSAAGKIVNITIPQYDASLGQKVAVYVNGMRKYSPDDYTISGAVITFVNPLVSGTEVTVYVTASKDGTGIPSIVQDVSKLQDRVASLESGLNSTTYTYFCNGATDNVILSDMVQTWLNGGTDYSTIKINVYGNFGATAPYGGAGTEESPYRWFSVGGGSTTTRRAILDFTNCSQIAINCASGTYNIILYGLQPHIIGANVIATGGESIIMFSVVAQTYVNAERCRFWITSANGYIARGGIFRECRGSLTCNSGDAFCFNTLRGGLLRIFGGEYYAYAPLGNTSAVVYVNSAQAGAVVNTYSMNCPTTARSNYTQTYAINCLSGDACCSFTDTITTLEIQADGQNVRGTIPVSRGGYL